MQLPTPYLNPAAFTQSPLTDNGTPLRVGTAPRYLPTIRGPANLSETFRINKKFYLGSEKRFFGLGATMTNPLKRKRASFASHNRGRSRVRNAPGRRRRQDDTTRRANRILELVFSAAAWPDDRAVA